jgi:hypothetical protein
MDLPQAPAVTGQPAGIEAVVAPDPGPLQQLANYMNVAGRAHGSAPTSTAFGSSEGAQALASTYGGPPSGTAQLPVPSSFTNVISASADDGLWTFAISGMEPGATRLTCGTVRETSVKTATTSDPLVQNGDFSPFLSPGRYSAITEVTGYATCVVTVGGELDAFGDNVGGISASGTAAQ